MTVCSENRTFLRPRRQSVRSRAKETMIPLARSRNSNRAYASAREGDAGQNGAGRVPPEVRSRARRRGLSERPVYAAFPICFRMDKEVKI